METLQVKVRVDKEGIDLAGWFSLPPAEKTISPGAKGPLLILCHGIPRAKPYPEEEGDSAADDGGYAALAEQCLSLGIPVFHFNFRGTGESGGDFDLSGWVRDLDTVFDYWQQKHPQMDFILWGFSGGAAVSACAAAGNPGVKGVILAACPASFESLFPREKRDEIIAWFRQVGIIRDPQFPADPQGWLEGIYRIKPLEAMARISPAPLLIIHGTGDHLIPADQAELLFQRAKEPKDLAILPEAGHQLRKQPEAVRVALDWLEEQLNTRRS